MMRFRRHGGAALLLLVVLLCLPAVAQGRTAPVRMWHGTPIPSLDSPPAFAKAARDPAPVAPGGGLTNPLTGPATIRLSDERTLTQWANPASRAAIYARPDAAAHRVGRLHMNTEDGFPEVYLLLQEYIDAN